MILKQVVIFYVKARCCHSSGKNVGHHIKPVIIESNPDKIQTAYTTNKSLVYYNHPFIKKCHDVHFNAATVLYSGTYGH